MRRVVLLGCALLLYASPALAKNQLYREFKCPTGHIIGPGGIGIDVPGALKTLEAKAPTASDAEAKKLFARAEKRFELFRRYQVRETHAALDVSCLSRARDALMLDYRTVIAAGSPYWAVAALVRMGEVEDGDLSNRLNETNRAKNINDEEHRPDADSAELTRQLLCLDYIVHRFELAERVAREYGVDSEWSRRATQRLEFCATVHVPQPD